MTKVRPLWSQMLFDIWHEKAERNDFESHGYNLIVWVLIAMGVTELLYPSTEIFWAVGNIGGLAGLYIREIVIDRRSPQPTDIISGDARTHNR